MRYETKNNVYFGNFTYEYNFLKIKGSGEISLRCDIVSD